MSGRNQPAYLSRRHADKVRGFRAMAAEHVKRVGQALRERREELKMSKAAFARTIHADVRTVTRYEEGETHGGLTSLETIAPALETTADSILARAAEIKQEEDNPAAAGKLERESETDSERLDRIEKQLEVLIEHTRVLGPTAPPGDDELEEDADAQSLAESGADAPTADDEPDEAGASGS